MASKFNSPGAGSKKPAPVTQKKGQTTPPNKVTSEKLFPSIYFMGGLFFLLLVIGHWNHTYSPALIFCLISAAIFITVAARAKNREAFFEPLSAALLLLLLQCALYFAGLFYGSYPKFALKEFFLNAGGLFIFCTAFMGFKRDHNSLPRVAGIFVLWVAAASLLSIELATSRFLLSPLSALSELLNADIPNGFAIFENNARMLSVLGNPNLFAPIAALSMFCALFLCPEPCRRKRSDALFMGAAIISCAAFVLCYSLGTIVSCGAAAVVAFFLLPKEFRKNYVINSAFCLVGGAICAFFVFYQMKNGLVPLLGCLVLSFVFAFLYSYKFKLPERGGSLSPVIRLSLFFWGAICLIAVVGAFFFTKPYSLNPGESFRRATALEPGIYTVEPRLSSPGANITIGVTSMSYEEAALKESAHLKTEKVPSGGSLQFEVPQGSAAVFFNISTDEAVTVTGLSVTSGASVKSLPLDYVLAPRFIVNRLQGLWVNDNAIQRFIFYRDGIRLALLSPLIGLGGGAFEGGLWRVADYYYETSHVHNELIQRFIDGGLLGLLLFCAFWAVIFAGIYRMVKKGEEPSLAAFLLVSTLMIFFHSMLEVDFSSPAFRVASSLLFAMAATGTGGVKLSLNKARPLVPFGTYALLAAALLLGGGRIGAITLLSQGVSFDSLKTAALIDPFNANDYRISYVMNAADSKNPDISTQRERYLKSLRRQNDASDLSYYLALYYFSRPGDESAPAIEAAEAYIKNNRVNPEKWDKIFALYNNVLDQNPADYSGMEGVISSMADLCSYLDDLNGGLVKKVEPSLFPYSKLRAASAGTVILDSRLGGDMWSFTERGKGKIKFLMPVSALLPYTIDIYNMDADSVKVYLNGERLAISPGDTPGNATALFLQSADITAEITIEGGNAADGAYFTLSAAR